MSSFQHMPTPTKIVSRPITLLLLNDPHVGCTQPGGRPPLRECRRIGDGQIWLRARVLAIVHVFGAILFLEYWCSEKTNAIFGFSMFQRPYIPILRPIAHSIAELQPQTEGGVEPSVWVVPHLKHTWKGEIRVNFASFVLFDSSCVFGNYGFWSLTCHTASATLLNSRVWARVLNFTQQTCFGH